MNQSPISDIRYELGRPVIVHPFDKLFQLDTLVDCGGFVYDFIYADGSPIDESLFHAPASDTDPQVFKVLEQSDSRSVGEY